jgi:DNA-binding MarR family transcriptional regulator
MKENYMSEVEIEHLELEREISQYITQAFLELDDGEQQLMKRFGLTLTQYWALVHLNDAEGRSLSELADLLICDKSNMTSVVDKLEERGLAERNRGKAGDRRYIRVVLTPEGKQLRNVLMFVQDHFLSLRLQSINVENLQQLREPLRQLASTLQAQSRKNEVSNMLEHAIEHSHAE